MEDENKNTFGNYEFESWVPESVKEGIISFWGCFGRTYKDWLNCNNVSMNTCNHGPGPNGFGIPPTGATVDYLILDYKVSKEIGQDLFKVVRGKYLHHWNNIGSVIDEHGEAHHISSCNRWVRVWQKGE